MTTADRLFTLRGTVPFDRLRSSELTVISEVVRERVWQPGDIICAAGEPVANLYITSDGGARFAGGEPLQPVFGAVSLLFDRPAPEPILADVPSGSRTLMIPKRHFFTIINECPGLLVGFFETAGAAVSPRL
ncbi:MAG TPA: cyclic nucleotide-binding domain-containing protein [Azospirillaceae bacterium]|nr:cyclic nucleotide-binding domain-containing protein [Azospirillaceae bacterium]